MIKFETIYKGTTFLGAEIDMFEVDEAGVEIPMNLTDVDILMHIKHKGEDSPALIYSTEDGSITIDSNTVVIPQHIPTLEFGKYVFDFSAVFSPEIIINGLAPGEWEILNPVTKR